MTDGSWRSSGSWRRLNVTDRIEAFEACSEPLVVGMS
jgi:hypothetical protein